MEERSGRAYNEEHADVRETFHITAIVITGGHARDGIWPSGAGDMACTRQLTHTIYKKKACLASVAEATL